MKKTKTFPTHNTKQKRIYLLKKTKMKKQFFSILPLLFFGVILVNAQEVTSYRGAFAPAPERQWTESWANFNPQNAVYGATTVTKSGVITANETWTANNVYLLQGIVYVDSLVTLTIEPGTVIRGQFNTALGEGTNASLLVQRGAKLIAEGTVCNPIVFTSDRPAGLRARQDWGGVLILGKARHNLGINNLIEGLSNASSRNFHGGTDDNDNSGVLKYVRIEYGGFIFSANNEINGLTMGSVGRGTEINYVQVSNNADDGFEWFGGSVNAKHLISYRNVDDDFDSDNGFSGTVQYGLIVRDPALADVSNSEGLESDNSASGLDGPLPKTSGKFYNVTQIGGFRCASNTNGTGVQPTNANFRRGARLRRNTDLKVVNSIFIGNWRGLFLDGSLALGNVDQDSLLFRNNIMAGDFTSVWTGVYAATPAENPTGTSVIAENPATRTRFLNADYGNDSLNTCSLLTNVWGNVNSGTYNPDFRPNTAGAGAVVIDPTNLNSGADLGPIVEIDGSLFTANQATDFLVDVLENGAGSTNGAIVISIAKPSGWNITVPGLTLTATNQSGANTTSNTSGGTVNSNGNWNFRDDGTNVIATSKPGVIIPKSGFVQIGFIATRKGTTSAGTNQSLGVTVSGGGDTTPANNGAIVAFGAL